MNDGYLWIKAFHLVAVIAWMAALLYLPRLFVYHAGLDLSGEAARTTSETFKIMERRLLKAIATPAMIAVWVLGLTLLFWPGMNWFAYDHHWLYAKLALVLGLSGLHGLFAKTVRQFAADANRRTPRSYRILNEAVTFGMVIIVILVIVKPF